MSDGKPLIVKSGAMTYNEYVGLHHWVAKQLGKPKSCSRCSKTTGYFDWANLSGRYLKDLTDWARLCRACHSMMDNRKGNPEVCSNGHRMVISNLFLHRRLNTKKINKPTISCLACKYNVNREQYRVRMSKYLPGNHPLYPSYRYFYTESTDKFYKLWGKETRHLKRVLLEFKLASEEVNK